MKAKLTNSNYEHFIELEAETLEEAVQLTKFGLNAIKKVIYKSTYLSKGKFKTYLSIATRKEQEITIAKPK